MKNAYLAVSYLCNENCSFCPCSKKEKQDEMLTDINKLLSTVDDMELNGVTDITLSGGEPTLYPHLTELISYIQSKKINVTVLSNGERFSSSDYISAFTQRVKMSDLKIITTLHSSRKEEHEKANQTTGSFARTIKGLHNLISNGARVIIKHCITKENFKDLLEFYKYCNDNFAESTDVQLCSIDYCGIPESICNDEKLLFKEVRPFLEDLFEYDMEIKKAGGKRKLYCINMPLCACDPYYWSYLPRHRDKMYDKYKDPHSDNVVEITDNVGVHKEYCRNCKVNQICCGTYYTAYDVCKSDCVVPYL